MLQVAQTQEFFDKLTATIIILAQWSRTELSQHPRRDLNSRCAIVYALSPNFCGKLVVSAVLQSKLSLMLSLLIIWGWLQRPVSDTTMSAHKSWVGGEDWGTQEMYAKRWHISALNNHLSHHCYTPCLKLSTALQPIRTCGLFSICLQGFNFATLWCVPCTSDWLCVYNRI